MMNFDTLTTRDVAIVPESAALLFVDAQNFCARPDGGAFAKFGEVERTARFAGFFDHVQREIIPNMTRLQSICREARIEVMYTVIENLTRDGRDRSLDYRITGFNVPKGSWQAKVLDEIRPADDEIVIPKTSSNVFVSTNIDYVLRNLGVRQLIIGGFLTDQCVGSAVRDACDLGYLVTLATDSCATYSAERHTHAIASLAGYCRRLTTDELCAELRETSATANGRVS